MFLLKIKRLHDEARVPGAAHPGDLGCDLYSVEDIVIPPGGQVKARTGIAVQFPPGWGGIIKDRSSMAAARIYTSAGVIDEGYRGEIMILLRNESESEYRIKGGDKIAQMLPQKVQKWQVMIVNDLSDTARAEGGFGSTGTQ